MAHIQTQSEWEAEMAEKILLFSRNEIYLDLRFFEVALSALQFRVVEGLQSTATDGESMFFSPEHVMRVFQKNSPFLNRCYLHTVLHCIFFHLWTTGNRDRQLWNLACDIAVEYAIDHMDIPCIRKVTGWQRQKMYEQLKEGKKSVSAAVVYRILEHLEEKDLRILQREFYVDDHCFWPKKEEQGMPNQNQNFGNWNQIARQTKLEEDRKGKETEDGETFLAAQMKVEKGKRSYREFLKKFSVLREEVRSDPDEFDLNYYSYGFRVYKNMPLIEPMETRESKKIQEFVVVVDTSYSTSGTLIKNFLKETFQILTEENSFFSNSRIRIIQCDDQIRMDEEVHSREELEALLNRFTIVGGGGTDFRPAFSYVNGLIADGKLKDLKGLLYFTDGKGIYPSKAPAYQTAFLFLDEYETDTVPPWAIRMELEPEEFAEKR